MSELQTAAQSVTPIELMTRLQLFITTILTRPARALLAILCITIITHLPSGFGSFVADDYMQWAMLKGSPALQALGFSKADVNKPFTDRLLDGFHFFSDKAGTLQSYRDYGNIPWWSGENISMVPFRPVAALTHWIDYTVFGDTLWLHQLHSLLYFMLLAMALYALYRHMAEMSQKGARESAINTTINSSLYTNQAMLMVAALATIMAIVDFSLTRSFLWVVARNSYLACTLGVTSLLCFIRWREQRGLHWLVASLALFAIALLTAEAALAVAGYMGAYVLCIERKPLVKKALIIAPVIAVILLWRIGYSEGGFGALNIAQYIDPGRSPAQFAHNFLWVFPQIMFNQIVGLDTLIVFFHPEQQWKFIALAWIVTIGCIPFILHFLRNSAVDRFWFVGSLVAAVPGTALISAESRTMTFVAIGFFYLLAKLLVTLYQQRERLSRYLAFGIILGWHLVLPLLMSTLLTCGILGYWQLSNQHDSVADTLNAGDTGLVIVNPEASGMMYYLPFDWAFQRYTLPTHLSVLSSGLETSDLTRVSEREFILSAPTGMPLTHRAPMRSLTGEKPALSAFYSSLYTQSFFTTPAQALHTGQVILNADTRITVMETNEVGPTRIKLEFIGPELPDHKAWQGYDWKTRRYYKFSPPAINETRRFVGPLDKDATVAAHG